MSVGFLIYGYCLFSGTTDRSFEDSVERRRQRKLGQSSGQKKPQLTTTALHPVDKESWTGSEKNGFTNSQDNSPTGKDDAKKVDLANYTQLANAAAGVTTENKYENSSDGDSKVGNGEPQGQLDIQKIKEHTSELKAMLESDCVDDERKSDAEALVESVVALAEIHTAALTNLEKGKSCRWVQFVQYLLNWVKNVSTDKSNSTHCWARKAFCMWNLLLK